MNLDEKLDALLKFIRVQTSHFLRGRFTIDELSKELNDEDGGISLDGDEKFMSSLSILFDKLLEDGFIQDMEMKKEEKPSYRITASGIQFVGYAQQRANLEEQKSRQRYLEEQSLLFQKNQMELQKKMLWVTLILAFGTLGMLFFETVKFLLEYF